LNEINGRVIFVADNLNISKLQILSNLPHLRTTSTFDDVLLKHQRESIEQLESLGTASFIDHTKLAAESTSEDIRNLCVEATTNSFAAVCVNGTRVDQVVREVKNTPVKVAAVVGFPLGASSSQSKRDEANDYYKKGVDEIDYVIDVGRIKDKDYKYVLANLMEIVSDAKKIESRRITVNVILECCLLTREEIIDASILCAVAGVDYVKTSTGFGKPIPSKNVSGATVEDVKIMKQTVGSKIKVKASGGVSDKDTLLKMILSGASRIGTSAGVKLVLTPEQAKNLIPNENDY